MKLRFYSWTIFVAFAIFFLPKQAFFVQNTAVNMECCTTIAEPSCHTSSSDCGHEQEQESKSSHCKSDCSKTCAGCSLTALSGVSAVYEWTGGKKILWIQERNYANILSSFCSIEYQIWQPPKIG